MSEPDEPDDNKARMDEFFATVSYADDREVKPWREVPATDASEDEPEPPKPDAPLAEPTDYKDTP